MNKIYIKSDRKKIDVSILILNYNTPKLSLSCVKSIIKYTKNVSYEIILIDNGSVDSSVAEFSRLCLVNQNIKILKNKINLGFAKGNNSARKVARGNYILFLNSDTEFTENTLLKCLNFLKNNKKIGALTVMQILKNNKLDKDARRSFPTPWVAFTHFSNLDKLFPESKVFSRYWVGYKPANLNQEIEVLQGSFFMSPKKTLDEVGWFDEEYFLDGEDIDLSWKIKEAGYVNYYLADTQIIHLKGVSKGKQNSKQFNAKDNNRNSNNFKERIKFVIQGVNSMEIFYRKRMWKDNSIIINYLMIYLIKVMKIYRIIKVYIEI